LDEKECSSLGKAMGLKSKPTAQEFLTACDDVAAWDEKSELRQFLTRCAATYLGATKAGTSPFDAVARFHLTNGARIERLNWGADPSNKGVKQSFSLMVNYLYDLKRLDKHRKALNEGEIPSSPEIQELILKSKK
jgi:malonyl-CoA decarboxylase